MPGLRRALLIGLDNYDNFSPLTGCTNDVQSLEPLIARNEDGSPNFDCVTRFGPTRDELIEAVTDLLAPGADIGLLYFAGHGAAHNNDVAICTRDGTSATPGVRLS